MRRTDHILVIVMLVVLIVGATAGWLGTREMEYRRGLIDGHRSTMLTDYTVEPCQVSYEIRHYTNDTLKAGWGAPSIITEGSPVSGGAK